MKKGLYLILPVILIAALLGGCFPMAANPAPSPTGPAPTIGPQIEPQQLIDRKTAETIVGNELKDMEVSKDKPSQIAGEGMSFCLYDTAGSGRFMQITLYKRTEVANIDPTLYFKALQSEKPKSSKSPIIAAVTGIGDEAFIADPGIHIIYQGYYVIISVGDPNLPENQEILKKAGTAAVDKLKTLLGK